MSANELREALKNLSGDELAQVQNAVVVAGNLEPAERQMAMRSISHELRMRQNEGLTRKAERFWNRHGERVGMLAIGAMLGDWFGD